VTYKISQTSFIRSLRPVFEDARLKWLSEDEICALLDRYWSAIKELCPEAVKNPGKYLLLKTTGVAALHSILPQIVAYLMSKGKKIREITKEDFRQVLEELDVMNDEFWSSENEEGAKRFLGQAGQRELARRLSDSLPRPED